MDKEKVIKGLANLKETIRTANQYTFTSDCVCAMNMSLIDNAIALLRKQEAKPMTEYDDGWDCPRCGLKLVRKTASGYPLDELDLPNDEIVKYCPVCGQAVKWE